MFHEDWKSRVNASVGIQGIMMLAAPQESQEVMSFSGLEGGNSNADAGLTVKTVLECLDQILAQGRPLYSRSDKIDTDDEDLEVLDEQRANQLDQTTQQQEDKDSFLQQRIRMQQDILQRRLGLGGIGVLASDASAFIADAISSRDLLPEPKQHEPARKRQRRLDDNKTSSSKSDPKLRVLLVLEMEEQLLRQRDSQGSNNNNSQQDKLSLHNNPQTLLASEVIYRMMDPKWEIRHGATLACLGLVKAWYRQSDSSSPTRTSSDAAAFGTWPQHVMVRCLCVLALDRFGDFSLGSVVAPVRESAGQLLSVLVAMAPTSVQSATLQVLFQLVEYQDDWEVRYAAFVALQFVGVLFLKGNELSDVNNNQVERIAVSATQGIQDKSDDVKGIAAKILAEHIQKSATVPALAYDCAAPLWTAVQHLDSLSASLPDLVGLLSLLIEHDANELLRRISIDRDAGSADKSNPLQALSQFAIRLLDSDVSSVRPSAMRCLRSLAKTLSDGVNDLTARSTRACSKDLYYDVLIRVFETFLARIDSDVESRRAFMNLRDETWGLLTFGCKALSLNSEARRTVELGLIVRYFGINSVRSRVGDSFEPTSHAASALGDFFGNTSGTLELSALISLSISVFLRSPWPNQCEAACLLLESVSFRWSPNAVPRELVEKLNSSLDTDRPVCLVYFSALGKAYLDALADASYIGFCDEAFTQGASALRADGSNLQVLVESIVETWSKATKARLPSHVGPVSSPSVLSMRLDATIAGALIVTELPAKLTPVVRALVTSIKNEAADMEANDGDILGDWNLSLRAEFTCRYMKKLLMSIDCKPELATTRMKVIQTLCNLAAEGNSMAETTIGQVVSAWSSTKKLTEIDGVWNSLELCLRGSNNKETLRSVRLVGIVCRGFSTDSAEVNKDAVLGFIAPLTNLACAFGDSDLRTQCLSSLQSVIRLDFVENFRVLLECLLPFLRNESDDLLRLCACMVLECLVSQAGVDICPFVRPLLPPILSLLTDPLKECAGICSKIFATLVRAAPLVQQQEFVEIEDHAVSTFSDRVVDHLILGKAMPPTPFPEIIMNTLSASSTVLREYQKEGITWLRFLQSVNLNGALCDSMGLGKTIQALIAVALSHLSSDGILDRDAISLIVCPASVVGHFIQEIDRFFPGEQIFRSLCLVGPTPTRRKVWSALAPDINIVVTSYSVLRTDVDLLANIEWRYCVLDEGHLLCNPKTGEEFTVGLFVAETDRNS